MPARGCKHDIWTRHGHTGNTLVHACRKCGAEWVGSASATTFVSLPPKPDDPQLRIIKEGHIPPKRYTSGGPPRCFTCGQAEWKCRCDPTRWQLFLDGVRGSDWLWFIVIAAAFFILGVGFAEWTQ